MIVNNSSGIISVQPSKEIAASLLEIGAVKFNLKDLFKWTSGIESPIYCDNRIINSKVAVRDNVVDAFTNLISIRFSTKPDIIAGVATGGMPYGAIIASRMNLPFVYVRSERKAHGLRKAVEGDWKKGDKVVLIEDHISTGISSIRAVEFLREEGLELICLLSIMTYRFKEAEDAFKRDNICFGSICNLDTILEVALNDGKLTQPEVDSILEFREDPKNWGPNKGKF
jgi:orotate phosphoribosyltransferase